MAPCRCTRWYVVFSREPGTSLIISDLPNHWLGRPARPSPCWYFRERRSCEPSRPRQRRQAYPSHLQRLRFRRAPLEVCPPAARSPRPPRRDGIGLLHCHQQERYRHYWRGNIQCDACAVCAILQQDPVLLLRGAATECWRDCGYAGVLLLGP